jgi:hypothetical protein
VHIPLRDVLDQMLEDIERRYLLKALDMNGGAS